MGYCCIISILKHQSFPCRIDEKELGLADMDPEAELLGICMNIDISFDIEDSEIERNGQDFEWYISDSISTLKDWAREAKKNADHPEEGFEDYNKGKVMAYCSTFSLLKQQAFALGIDENKLGLTDVDPKTYQYCLI